MSHKGKISRIWMYCVLASTEYLAWEHRTATACSKIDILDFTSVSKVKVTPVFGDHF